MDFKSIKNSLMKNEGVFDYNLCQYVSKIIKKLASNYFLYVRQKKSFEDFCNIVFSEEGSGLS